VERHELIHRRAEVREALVY